MLCHPTPKCDRAGHSCPEKARSAGICHSRSRFARDESARLDIAACNAAICSFARLCKPSDSTPIENWVPRHFVAGEKISGRSSRMSDSFHSIHPAHANGSPRHKALCNRRKQSSERKNSTRDPACRKLAPDNRTCCIQTNTFGPWLIDLYFIVAREPNKLLVLGSFPTARLRCPATKVAFSGSRAACNVRSCNGSLQQRQKLIRARAR